MMMAELLLYNLIPAHVTVPNIISQLTSRLVYEIVIILVRISQGNIDNNVILQEQSG